MNRFAIFVDAGYFFAGGGKAAFDLTQRNKLSLPNPRECVDDIIERAGALAGNTDLLRVYWYDALTGTTPTTTQSTIAHLHGVKLRLGVVNRTGEQKGVDSLIVTDMIDLARNRAIADVVLIAGDEDLRVAVQVAQAYGVRVHILAAGLPSRNVSPSLQMEADSVHNLDGEWFKKHFTLASVESREQQCGMGNAASGLGIPAAAEKTINEIFKNVEQAEIDKLKTLFKTDTVVPSEYDRSLIACTARYVGRRLSGQEKRQIRGIFVKWVRQRGNA